MKSIDLKLVSKVGGTMDKQILIDLGTVRISEYDAQNIKIECLEKVRNPVTKETNIKWTFKGYSRTILTALESILKNELLIEQKAVSDLESYLKLVRESNGKIKRLIASMK